jgi:catechol 2,3-dioxygenase-like lactoylglutathione lyase family enzyme
MTIKLDHINLTVADLKNSIEWYGKVFGFELVESGTTPQGIKWGIVAFNDSMICMTEYTGRIAADKVEDKSTHQIYHFGIRVSDLEQWQQTVKDHQLKLYYSGEIKYPTSKSWYIHDPSGHEIEVSYAVHGRMQFPSGGIQ